MGFWHTGYMEFHEPTGWDKELFPTGPSQVVYRCRFCDSEFDDPGDLRQHRFEEHPVDRPVLFINGLEVGSAPIHVTSRLTAKDVALDQSDSAKVNGQSVGIEQLAVLIASADNDRLSIELSNDDVKASYVVDVKIAQDHDIEGVEREFMSVVAGKRLDLRTVEDFINATDRFRTASRYFDGVCEYLYGVMAREHSPELSIKPDQYVGKFNRAADLLKGFDRPLSNVIRALIGFHLNDFETARRVALGSRVTVASERMSVALRQGSFDEEIAETSMQRTSLDRLLSDWGTENLIIWALKPLQELATSLNELETMLAMTAGDYDGLKLRLLLCYACRHRGDANRARRHARVLRNSPSVGDWAESFLRSL